MKNICEICKGKNLPVVLNLGKHPLCDDLIKVGSNKKSKFYKIEVIFCKNCITAYQKYQVPKKKLFPPSYHYRSKFTKDVISGLQDVVKNSKIFSGWRDQSFVVGRPRSWGRCGLGLYPES